MFWVEKHKNRSRHIENPETPPENTPGLYGDVSFYCDFRPNPIVHTFGTCFSTLVEFDAKIMRNTSKNAPPTCKQPLRGGASLRPAGVRAVRIVFFEVFRIILGSVLTT